MTRPGRVAWVDEAARSSRLSQSLLTAPHGSSSNVAKPDTFQGVVPWGGHASMAKEGMMRATTTAWLTALGLLVALGLLANGQAWGQLPGGAPPARAAGAAAAEKPLPKAFISRETRLEIPFSVQPGSSPDSEPAAVRIYVSWDRGKTWHFNEEKRPDEGKFQFQPRQDGEFWFTTQTIDRSGRADVREPREPRLILIIDTKEPQLLVQPVVLPGGDVRVALSAADPHLNPQIVLEYQDASDSAGKWNLVEPEPSSLNIAAAQVTGDIVFKPKGSMKVINVRVEATDSAGNKAYFSQRLPLNPPKSAAGAGAMAAAPPPDPSATRWPTENQYVARPESGAGTWLAQKNDSPAENESLQGEGSEASSETRDGIKTPPGIPNVVLNPYSRRDRLISASSPSPSQASTDELPAPRETVQSGTPDVRDRMDRNVSRETQPIEPSEDALPPPAAYNAPTYTAPAYTAPAYTAPSNTAPTDTAPTYESPRVPREPIESSEFEQPDGFEAPQGSLPNEAVRPDPVPPQEPVSPQETITPAPAIPDRTIVDAPLESSGETGNNDSSPSESIDVPTGQRPRLTSSRRFSLEYDVESVGPEGVAEVELWGTSDGGRTWMKWGSDPDRQSPFDVEVNSEAIYGFRVVIVGKNGLATTAPQNGDAADIWVGVDLTRPQVRLVSAAYGKGSSAGKLDIRWEADDPNLSSRPVTLSIADRPDGQFTPIAAGLPNSGQYLWSFDPRSPRQIYLRLEVRDEAGNAAIDQLTEPILVEGLQPKGRIKGFAPGGESRDAYRPPLAR